MNAAVRRRSSGPVAQALTNRRQLLVFAEGQKTEDLYLTKWHRLYREHVVVTLAPHKHTTPFELAKAAADRRRADLREAKRGRGAAYHEYWCVFDVDQHPRIPEALELARANNVRVALSSPCIELWFLIHFVERTAYIDRDDAQACSEAFLGCTKVLTQPALDLLVEHYRTAKARAQGLEVKHIGDGAVQPWNPQSTVWQLVDSVMATAT